VIARLLAANALELATGAGAANRGNPLVSITVQLHRPKHAEDAANRLAAIVKERTTEKYVGTKIATYEASLKIVNTQLESIANRVAALNAAIRTQGLAALDKLVLVSQIDNAEQREGQLLDQKTLVQQQLALANNVESAQVVEPASAVKSTARSRRNSVLVGALIGLVLGAIAAIVGDARAPRARPA